MPKLNWDQIGERLYETGTKNVVLFPQENDGTYPKGAPWNGVTGVSTSPSGADATPYYADDQKYIELRGAENFGGTIGAFTFPDEWYPCDGCKVIVPGVIAHQQTRQPFGLTWRTTIGNDVKKEDYGYKIHVAWNATCSPSGRDYQTMNESPEAINMSWEFSTTPVKVTTEGMKPLSYLEFDSTKLTKAQMTALEDILYGKNGTFTATSDDSPSASKTYFTKNANNEYVKFTGSTFESGATYYEETGGSESHLPSPDDIIAAIKAAV